MLFKGLINQTSTFFQTCSKIFHGGTNKLLHFIKKIPHTVKTYRAKLQNLGETNLNLAIYHYQNRNLNDAIFRFKVVEKYFPNLANNDFNYYMGRCYLEKGNAEEAEKYLNDYLKNIKTHPDSKFLEEAEFSLKIAKSENDNINRIPISLIQRKFDTEAKLIEHTHLTEKLVKQKYPIHLILFELLKEKLEINESTKKKPHGKFILDLGCNRGVFGYLANESNLANFVIGVDISTKMLKLSKEIRLKDNKVYSDLINDSVEEYLAKSVKNTETKFNVIFAYNIVSYTSEIKNIFNNLKHLASLNGILCLTFDEMPSNNAEKNDHVIFNSKTETFMYTKHFIDDTLAKSGWNIIISKDIIYDAKTNAKKCLVLATNSNSVVDNSIKDNDAKNQNNKIIIQKKDVKEKSTTNQTKDKKQLNKQIDAIDKKSKNKTKKSKKIT